jgi:DNA-binding beta-propeller fold protein YncE
MKDITGLAEHTSDGDLIGDDNFYYTLAHSSTFDNEYKVIKIDASDLSGEVLFSTNTAPLTASRQLTRLTFNADKTALYFTQDTSLYRYQLSNGSLTLVTALTYPASDHFYLEYLIIDESNDRVIIEANWTILSPYESGKGFYAANLSGAQAGVFENFTASNQSGCSPLPTRGIYYSPIYDGKLYMTYDSERETIASFDLATDCLTKIKDIIDVAPRLTADSLQGIDIDPATGILYLGHFSTTSMYDIASNMLTMIEPQGFIKDANPVVEPLFDVYDKASDILYFADEDKLIAWDLSKGQRTLLHTASDDIIGITLSQDGKTLYYSDDNSEIGAWDINAGTFQLITSGVSPDIEYLTAIDENTLAFFDSDQLYLYKLTDNSVSLLSDKETDGIKIWREDSMRYDHANQRLILDNEIDSKSRFVAVSLKDGSRTYLNESNPIDGRMGTFDLSDDGESIIYEYDNRLYTYDVTDNTRELLYETGTNGFGMSDPETITVRDAQSIFIGDSDVNGFWLINTLTGERTLLH